MVFIIQDHERQILQLISQKAKALGFPAYLVGGYVRDRLLARRSKDIDIVCVGSGIDLAEEIASSLRPIPRIAVYRRFGTAMIKHGDLEIEFVGARKESYRHDSRKPAVEEGSLEDDQNRRDFTINALAVSLNGGRAVTAHSVGGKEVSIAISTRGKTNSVRRIALEFAGNEVLGNNSASTAIDDYHVLHLGAGVEFHRTVVHFLHQ